VEKKQAALYQSPSPAQAESQPRESAFDRRRFSRDNATRISAFGFLSVFGPRISDLEWPGPPRPSSHSLGFPLALGWLGGRNHLPSRCFTPCIPPVYPLYAPCIPRVSNRLAVPKSSATGYPRVMGSLSGGVLKSPTLHHSATQLQIRSLSGCRKRPGARRDIWPTARGQWH
jgi:hypothetical protein